MRCLKTSCEILIDSKNNVYMVSYYANTVYNLSTLYNDIDNNKNICNTCLYNYECRLICSYPKRFKDYINYYCYDFEFDLGMII